MNKDFNQLSDDELDGVAGGADEYLANGLPKPKYGEGYKYCPQTGYYAQDCGHNYTFKNSTWVDGQVAYYAIDETGMPAMILENKM